MIGAARIGAGEGGRLALGLGLLIVGIWICAWASILRDRAAGGDATPPPVLAASLVGIALAILSGVLSALLNTAFAYGGDLIAQAASLGLSPTPASLAVWVPALFGGFLVNLVGTGWKLKRSKGWKQYQEAPAADWFWASSLGFIWFGGVLAYGISSLRLGNGGTVYGWAVCNGVTILTSTAWGFASGEWKQAGRAAKLWMLAGVGVFLAAFGVLAAKN
jgi:hypothetical protein